MKTQTDCTNTRTIAGRNATPLAIIEAAKATFNGSFLDPSSDRQINELVGADQFYSLGDDGFTQDWAYPNVWLNPPGRSLSNGKQITAIQWIRKLYKHWESEEVGTAIALCYRSTTMHNLPCHALEQALMCSPCSGASSSIVNNSGRLAFEEVGGDGDRIPMGRNPSGSVILCWSHDARALHRFFENFSQFGVVWRSYLPF